MTLLPDIERELLRVAQTHEHQAAPHPTTGHLRSAAASIAVAGVVALVVLLLLILPGAHHRPTHPISGVATVAPSSLVPIRDQPGNWRGGANTCPRAPRQQGIPADVGCVSVVHADIDGDGHTDTAVLYAALTDRRYGTRYAPKAFWLVVHLANGHMLQTRLPHPESNAFFLQHGNENSAAGDELVVQVTRISSGSNAVIYTDAGGHLHRESLLLSFGGDSVTKSGFACFSRPILGVVQRTYELLGSRARSPWQETSNYYRWDHNTLHLYWHHTTTIPQLEPRATTLSRSCGMFDVSPASLR